MASCLRELSPLGLMYISYNWWYLPAADIANSLLQVLGTRGERSVRLLKLRLCLTRTISAVWDGKQTECRKVWWRGVDSLVQSLQRQRVDIPSVRTSMRGEMQFPSGDTTSVDEHLAKFESVYKREQAKADPSPDAKFNYGWALTRSNSREQIRQGRDYLQELLRDGYNEKDCLYFLGIANYRLDNALEAKKVLKRLLQKEPDCRQALVLMQAVDEKINKDGWVGIGLAGLLVAVIAGVASGVSRRS